MELYKLDYNNNNYSYNNYYNSLDLAEFVANFSQPSANFFFFVLSSSFTWTYTQPTGLGIEHCKNSTKHKLGMRRISSPSSNRFGQFWKIRLQQNSWFSQEPVPSHFPNRSFFVPLATLIKNFRKVDYFMAFLGTWTPL